MQEFGIIKGALTRNMGSALMSTFIKLIKVSAERNGLEIKRHVREYNFSEMIIFVAEEKPEVLTDAINAFHHTSAFNRLFGSPRFQKKIAETLFEGCDVDDLILTVNKFRIDLPSRFVSEKEKFSLSWHQESGYFSQHVSHEEGYVVWLPLMSVTEEQGALRVLPNSAENGPLRHKSKYLDPENKRNLRKDVPENLIKKYQSNEKSVEVKKGDAAFFHFNTIHSSGINSDTSYVRCTFQTRVCKFKSPSFSF